jgi:hypothetical protein
MEKESFKYHVIIFMLFAGACIAPDAFAEWVSMPSGVTNNLKSVWGSASNDVFAVGSNGVILHYDGATWTKMGTATTANLEAISGSAANNIVAAGITGTFLRYKGTSWLSTGSSSNQNLTGVWSSPSSESFVVGENGTIQQCDDRDCSPMVSSTILPLNAIWGASSTDIVAVGANGIILHYDGINWTKMQSSSKEHLYAVWGVASNDVFAAGANGTILHYNGANWSKMPVGTIKDFWAINGTYNDYMFAVGDEGNLFRYDGSTWTETESGTAYPLQGVWVSPSNDVFVVGASGEIIFYKNIPPTAAFLVNKPSGYTTETFSFDASASSDVEDGKNDLLVRWDWEGDGRWDTEYSASKTANYQYSTEGTYTVTLEVMDKGMLVSTASQTISVSVNTSPIAQFTVTPGTRNNSNTITVDASESYDNQDPAGVLEVRWDWEGDGPWDTEFSTAKTAAHTYATINTYEIRMEIRDSGGLTNSTAQKVTLKEGRLCIASVLLGEDDPRLNVLRKFRDEFLVRSEDGRQLIHLYYSQGEELTKLIEANPVLKHLARNSLEAIIPTIEKVMADSQYRVFKDQQKPSAP